MEHRRRRRRHRRQLVIIIITTIVIITSYFISHKQHIKICRLELRDYTVNHKTCAARYSFITLTI